MLDLEQASDVEDEGEIELTLGLLSYKPMKKPRNVPAPDSGLVQSFSSSSTASNHAIGVDVEEQIRRERLNQSPWLFQVHLAPASLSTICVIRTFLACVIRTFLFVLILFLHCALLLKPAKAARALANLAAHGDSNINNAAVGQEPGALEVLVQLSSSSHEGVRQEAVGVLCLERLLSGLIPGLWLLLVVCMPLALFLSL